MNRSTMITLIHALRLCKNKNCLRLMYLVKFGFSLYALRSSTIVSILYGLKCIGQLCSLLIRMAENAKDNITIAIVGKSTEALRGTKCHSRVSPNHHGKPSPCSIELFDTSLGVGYSDHT